MKKILSKINQHTTAFMIIGFFTLLPTAVHAQLQQVPRPTGSNLPGQLLGSGGALSKIANVLLILIGAIAVIMLIVGGFRYVISSGDSNAIEGAKNTILYAIIGIVVAFLSYAAINFLTAQLT